MKIVLQKVRSASVSVDGERISSIDTGYLIFLGIASEDTAAHAKLLAQKIVNLRLFDRDGKINDQSICDVGGSILVVSQFTLLGSTKKGNRPDYTRAAKSDDAKQLYEYFVSQLRLLGAPHIETGQFGANMQVELVNDGPVTLVLDQ